MFHLWHKISDSVIISIGPINLSELLGVKLDKNATYELSDEYGITLYSGNYDGLRKYADKELIPF